MYFVASKLAQLTYQDIESRTFYMIKLSMSIILTERNEQMRYYMSFLCIIFPFFLMSQTSKNIELVAQVPLEATANDIWGFKHSNGTEYAIVGDMFSTHIYSLADPKNPVEVANIFSATSVWRDMKNYKDVVYMVSDQGRVGISIIDMAMIDQDSVSHSFLKPDMSGFGTANPLERCHNLYIDEAQGYLYLAGCNILNGGIIILDLNNDPLLPEVVGVEKSQYAHDVFVRDNLMFSSQIYLGEMAIFNVEDKSTPVFLGSIPTPGEFTHNIWTSEDNKYAFTTDERANAPIGAYDISSPEDIKFLDKFNTNAGVESIPHNTHFHDNYLFTSWYTEGIIITDVSHPDNIIEVGHYDTFDGPTGGFNGCWGAYPFLPSGLLLANDMQNGFFVLRPNLVRASYLEGTVTELGATNADGSPKPLNNANIKINSGEDNLTSSDPNGLFRSGQATSGEFSVTISKVGYFPVDTTITLISGEITELNIELEKRILYSVLVYTNSDNGEPLYNTQILLENEEEAYILNSSNLGRAIKFLPENEYRVYSGKWGNRQKDHGTIKVTENTEVELELIEGYEDDFLFDFGWETFSDASSGEWVRGIPVGTAFQGKKANVDFDLPFDLGMSCFMTGNAGDQADSDDVDNGTTTLTSDWFSAEGLDEPSVQYYRWFYNGGDENIDPNDSLNVFLISPVDTQLVETIKSDSESGQWIKSKINLDPTDDLKSLKIMFVAQDDLDDGHIVEAGIDGFRVVDLLLTSTNDLEETSKFNVYPNPIDEVVIIKSTEFLGPANIRIFNTQGQLVYKDVMDSKEKQLILGTLNSGTYFLNVEGKGFKQTIKLIKI